MHSAFVTDRGQIEFISVKNRTKIRLEADSDHLIKRVSVWLFGPDQSSMVLFKPAQKVETKVGNQLWSFQSRRKHVLRDNGTGTKTVTRSTCVWAEIKSCSFVFDY